MRIPATAPPPAPPPLAPPGKSKVTIKVQRGPGEVCELTCLIDSKKAADLFAQLVRASTD